MILFALKVYPFPTLLQPANPVTVFDDDLRVFVDNLFSTMYACQGIGLAAPQVGGPFQVSVVDASCGKDASQKLALINPVIMETSGEQVGIEGCLSLPNLRSRLKRPNRVKVAYQDIHGEPQTVEGEGLLARALMHEVEHLQGKLYIDALSSLGRSLILNKVRKLQKRGVW